MVTKQKFVVQKDGTIRGVTPVSKRVKKAERLAKKDRTPMPVNWNGFYNSGNNGEYFEFQNSKVGDKETLLKKSMG